MHYGLMKGKYSILFGVGDESPGSGFQMEPQRHVRGIDDGFMHL